MGRYRRPGGQTMQKGYGEYTRPPENSQAKSIMLHTLRPSRKTPVVSGFSVFGTPLRLA